MNELAAILHARLEADPRAKLSQLEWEILPNEVRGLPRIGPTRRGRVPRRMPAPPMTTDDWSAWGL